MYPRTGSCIAFTSNLLKEIWHPVWLEDTWNSMMMTVYVSQCCADINGGTSGKVAVYFNNIKHCINKKRKHRVIVKYFWPSWNRRKHVPTGTHANKYSSRHINHRHICNVTLSCNSIRIVIVSFSNKADTFWPEDSVITWLTQLTYVGHL